MINQLDKKDIYFPVYTALKIYSVGVNKLLLYTIHILTNAHAPTQNLVIACTQWAQMAEFNSDILAKNHDVMIVEGSLQASW